METSDIGLPSSPPLPSTFLPSSPPKILTGAQHQQQQYHEQHDEDRRPNRWTGPPQSWRSLTADDRSLFETLEQQENQDIGIQLFNVHVLRRNGLRARRKARESQVTSGQAEAKFSDSEDAQHVDDVYVPPRRWTAWPVRLDRLPKHDLDFMGPSRGSAHDDRLTYRRIERHSTGDVVKEEIVASVLRFAKERFRARMAAEQMLHASIEESDASEGDNDADEESDDESGSEDEESEDEESESESESENNGEPETSYEAVVSADDDLSARLLKPSVQHIMSRVDEMLRVLHNNRMAAVPHIHDSSSSESDDQRPVEPPPKKTQQKVPPKTTTTTTTAIQPEPKQSKPDNALPVDLALSIDLPPSAQPPQPAPKKRTWEPYTPAQREAHREDWLARWTPRTWYAVLDAAAHAGFSDAVLQRTAQRCADLFDESITLHTLPEGPLSTTLTTTPAASTATGAAMHTRVIAPRPGALRHASVDPVLAAARSGSLHDLDVQDARALQRTAQVSRQTASPGTRLVFCPVESCARAVRGFDKWSNFRRHVVTVHDMPAPQQSRSRSRSASRDAGRGMRGAGTPGLESGGTDTENEGGGVGVEEDSEDEMVGAVHVDGFLKAFKLKRGWRGAEKTGRKKRRVEGPEQGTPVT